MDHFRQSYTFLQRLSLRSAVCLFVGLFSYFGLNLTRQWMKANHYHAVAAILVGIGLLSLIPIRFSGSSVSAKRLRWGVFLLSFVSSLIFVIKTPLPITSLMIDVIHIPKSMEFFLQHHSGDTRGKWLSVYRTRGDSHTMVSFSLPRPIRGKDEDLQLYMGYNPHRVHFGRYPSPVEIDKVDFGTVVFGFPLPFTVYKGQDLSVTAGIIGGPHILAFINNRIRAPMITIMWDEHRVRKDSTPIRIVLIKMVWIILYFGLSALILWSGLWMPWLKPVEKTIEKYLMQQPV